jgi:hypothetical protein
MRVAFRLGDCDPTTCSNCGPRVAHPLLRVSGWTECPERARREPSWQGVIRLYNLSKISPLAGWGVDYTPLAEDGVTALSAAIDKVAADRLNEQSANRPGRR